MRQTIRTQFAGPEAEPTMVVLDAANRRDKALEVHVTPIRDHGGSAPAAMLAMDVIDA